MRVGGRVRDPRMNCPRKQLYTVVLYSRYWRFWKHYVREMISPCLFRRQEYEFRAWPYFFLLQWSADGYPEATLSDATASMKTQIIGDVPPCTLGSIIVLQRFSVSIEFNSIKSPCEITLVLQGHSIDELLGGGTDDYDRTASCNGTRVSGTCMTRYPRILSSERTLRLVQSRICLPNETKIFWTQSLRDARHASTILPPPPPVRHPTPPAPSLSTPPSPHTPETTMDFNGEVTKLVEEITRFGDKRPDGKVSYVPPESTFEAHITRPSQY